MATKSLAQQMIDKKKAEEEATSGATQSGTAGATSSVPSGGDPLLNELQAAVDKELDTKKGEASAQDVAKQAGATETPSAGDDPGKGMTTFVKQTKTPTKEEVQTARTEVSTNVDIAPSDPTGANVADPNPPLGTLPNSNMVFNGEPGAVMTGLHTSLEAGLAQNKVSDEENEIAMKRLEGELRRQRMLEGRPQAGDILAEQEEAEPPEGGYKSNGITRYVNSVGNWVPAVNGYFLPADNEADEAILEHYVKTGVVEAPAGKKSKK